MTTPSLKTWLNVGSGKRGSGLRPPALVAPPWLESTLDADSRVTPDIVSQAHDLRGVMSGSFDAVFSSHCIEHLYLDQAVGALQEWKRVLKPDGFLLLVCPDLQAAAAMIADDRMFEIAYAGIRPYDIVFSHQGLVAEGRAAGHTYMEHKSGYTLSLLRQLVNDAGFASHAALRVRSRFELWLLACPLAHDASVLRAKAEQYFPVADQH